MASSDNKSSIQPLIKSNSRRNAANVKLDPNRSGPSNPYMRIKAEANSNDGAASSDRKPFPSERLSSIRLPRDLTLGGISSGRSNVRPNLVPSNKKVYTPNLNAIRNKNVDVKTSRDTSGLNNHSRGGRSERGTRGRGRGASTRNALVTTSGLFSEGAGDGSTKRLLGRYRGSNDASEATAVRRPTLIKKEKHDPQLEQKHINEIYDLDDDFLAEEDQLSSSDNFTPVNLLNVKEEVKLEHRLNGLEIKEEDKCKSEKLLYPDNLDEFLDRTTPQIFLLQLPDTLPGHGPIQEPAESAEHERPSSPDPEASYCTMGQLEEGRIGRLVRYRSGKTKLILGDSQFDIDLGIEPGLLQECVSLTTNSTERSGTFINLGQISAKLTAIPDWSFMLNNIVNKKS